MLFDELAMVKIVKFQHPRLQPLFKGGPGSPQDYQPQDPDDQTPHSR